VSSPWSIAVAAPLARPGGAATSPARATACNSRSASAAPSTVALATAGAAAAAPAGTGAPAAGAATEAARAAGATAAVVTRTSCDVRTGRTRAGAATARCCAGSPLYPVTAVAGGGTPRYPPPCTPRACSAPPTPRPGVGSHPQRFGFPPPFLLAGRDALSFLMRSRRA
jgi:hypothetical protein